METMKAAYNFLKADNESPGGFDEENWSRRIAGFLSWPEKRVREAIANLRSAKEIDLDGVGKAKDVPHVLTSVFKELPTQKHAAAFRQAVKATKASPKVQKEVAKTLRREARKRARPFA